MCCAYLFFFFSLLSALCRSTPPFRYSDKFFSLFLAYVDRTISIIVFSCFIISSSLFILLISWRQVRRMVYAERFVPQIKNKKKISAIKHHRFTDIKCVRFVVFFFLYFEISEMAHSQRQILYGRLLIFFNRLFLIVVRWCCVDSAKFELKWCSPVLNDYIYNIKEI